VTFAAQLPESRSTPGPVLKREGEKGVKIKIFGPFFLGFSPEIDPRAP